MLQASIAADLRRQSEAYYGPIVPRLSLRGAEDVFLNAVR
jgi:hypothetical protein